MNDNDFDQLSAWQKRHEVEVIARADTQRQLEAVNASLAQALEALDRIANMSVISIALATDDPQAWRQMTMKLKATANAAWHSVVGVDEATVPDVQAVVCGDELPPFLSEARRRRMQEIYNDLKRD